ncbi:MAG: hypothetical protein WC696_01990 [Candidatus Methylopumilus sp.]|jgi:hypothetical protein
MMNAYVIVEMAKRRQGISSDRQFALTNKLSTQNIVDWKAGRCMPSWENMDRLAEAAGIEVWEAVKIMKEEEVRASKQAGFATLPMMLATSGIGIAGMPLLTVPSPTEALIGAPVGGVVIAGYTLCEVNMMGSVED